MLAAGPLDPAGFGKPEAIAAFGQSDDEFRLFNTDRQLAALQTGVAMLESWPERKTLIYFGGGLRLNGTGNQAQLRATVSAALRANVTLNPVDARGLIAAPPFGDAAQAPMRLADAFSGRVADAMRRQVERSQDVLYALAADTGGRATLDSNDLTGGMVDAISRATTYYLLGYYSTHTAADGRFRRVRIALRGGRQGELSYRDGYFGDKLFTRLNGAEQERQLEDALMSENPVTDIPLAVEVNYFQLTRAEYFVPVAVKAPGEELTLASRRGAKQTRLDVIGEIRDDYGVVHRNLRDRVEVALSADTAARLAGRAIQYQTGFTLLPGRYVLKILVRDATSGHIGTYETPFAIPNLERDTTRLPISSVVLGSQLVPLGAAVHDLRRDALADAVDPLVRDGQRLMPSVTRVFKTPGDLHIYLQAYVQGDSPRPLVAYVGFYQRERKVFETARITIADPGQSARRTIGVPLTVPLAAVAPGQYDCQVTVLDPAADRLAFWRAPIVISR